MNYIGIDPGRRGGIAAIWRDGRVETWPISALIKVCNIFNQEHCVFCLETVHSMPKQGVKSMFTFGREYGYIEGVLDAFMLPHMEVAPEIWKKEFGLGKDKKQSIEMCKSLFPDVDLFPTKRSRVESDGLAEALLIAEYARRKVT